MGPARRLRAAGELRAPPRKPLSDAADTTSSRAPMPGAPGAAQYAGATGFAPRMQVRRAEPRLGRARRK
jgi:hypothetical protein